MIEVIAAVEVENESTPCQVGAQEVIVVVKVKIKTIVGQEVGVEAILGVIVVLGVEVIRKVEVVQEVKVS